MLAVCGAALCENVEGSFLCLCASDLEEYDAQEGHCRPRAAGGEIRETRAPSFPAIFHEDSALQTPSADLAPATEWGSLGPCWGYGLGMGYGGDRSLSATHASVCQTTFPLKVEDDLEKFRVLWDASPHGPQIEFIKDPESNQSSDGSFR